MELQMQKVHLQQDKQGNIIEGSERTEPVKTFEWKAATDAMSAAIGGGFISNWRVDFLQKVLGKDGICSRYYFDRKIAVDIGDPRDKISIKKRKLLFAHGQGYLCIPVNFPTDAEKLHSLYQAAVAEYYAYEEEHPRSVEYIDTTFTDDKGNIRRALMTPIDTRVGGGFTSSTTKQKREFEMAKKLGKKEVKALTRQMKARKAIRRALEANVPFRNPFVGPNKRKYAVNYAS
jgi:hypothetical protein